MNALTTGMRELTADELDNVVGGHYPIAQTDTVTGTGSDSQGNYTLHRLTTYWSDGTATVDYYRVYSPYVNAATGLEGA